MITVLEELHRLSARVEVEGIGNAADAVSDCVCLLKQIQDRCTDLLRHESVTAEANVITELAGKIPLRESEKSLWRTLSPSDFGPHNFIVGKDKVRIVDLEHFGWDDPHKLVADTLLHPLIAWDEPEKHEFIRAATELYDLQKERLESIVSLAYGKWACIVLGRVVRANSLGNLSEERTSRRIAHRFMFEFEKRVCSA